MELTAREVQEKQFHDAWRGYNQEEVDDFLDRVAETIAVLERDNQALRGRLREVDQMLEASRSTEDMLKKTLVTAQQAAEEAITQARDKAEQLVAEAEARAGRANDELRRRVETAEEEVKRKTAEAEARAQERQQALRVSIERLEGFEGEIKRRLRAFLDMQMKTLDAIDASEPVAQTASGAPSGAAAGGARPDGQTQGGRPQVTVSSRVAEDPSDPAASLPLPESADDVDLNATEDAEDYAATNGDEMIRRRARRGLFRRDARDAEEAPQPRA